PQCPMHNATSASSSSPYQAPPTPLTPAKCPVQHDSPGLNPLNSIPLNLSTAKQPNQSLDLPTSRTSSTIPRKDSDDGPTWDYPSPQQFYNALVRKGWETPEDSIEVMVDIHNFLNEQAWQEVMKWERKLPGGEDAHLQSFQGRPKELSPKARFHLLAGRFFPSKFNTEAPFDRHDWQVVRPAPSAANPNKTEWVTTRYVIDYYSAPPDEEGNPVFHLDVRPALDNLESISLRVNEWISGEIQ
ncbi:cytochrome c heme-lyase, partial [Tremellales sp. Uapishka_1]